MRVKDQVLLQETPARCCGSTMVRLPDTCDFGKSFCSCGFQYPTLFCLEIFSGFKLIRQNIFMRTYRVSGTWNEMLNNGDRVSSLPELRDQFSSVQSLSCVWLCDLMDCSTPDFTVITNSWSLLRLMSIESLMASNQLILCHPPFLLPSIFPSIRIFSNESVFASGGQSIGVSASASVLPMSLQDWFPLGWIGWISLQSKGLSRVFSNTTVQKHQFFGSQLSL